MPVTEFIRQLVRRQAHQRCEYCHSPEWLSAARFTLDHLVPQSHQGSDEPENLALACRRCNERRYNFTTGVDPETGAEVGLFNPRIQLWSEHFLWCPDGTRILGVSPVGRATCSRLDLNDDLHDDQFIMRVRMLWARGGWHPPADDPRQS